jgi:hypothetical protein
MREEMQKGEERRRKERRRSEKEKAVARRDGGGQGSSEGEGEREVGTLGEREDLDRGEERWKIGLKEMMEGQKWKEEERGTS